MQQRRCPASRGLRATSLAEPVPAQESGLELPELSVWAYEIRFRGYGRASSIC